MIGGTSGAETKLCQPSTSQSNRTHTRSSWLGSRKTLAPLDPCSLRFTAPFVEKTSRKRSTSSTVAVARIICSSFVLEASPLEPGWIPWTLDQILLPARRHLSVYRRSSAPHREDSLFEIRLFAWPNS